MIQDDAKKAGLVLAGLEMPRPSYPISPKIDGTRVRQVRLRYLPWYGVDKHVFVNSLPR